ncbi:hypothetical protein [Nocardia alba]|uniref:Uncharacterized protein n=1 Tax=Nocardia alba TaxID=225051 RepID=A0A4R1FFT5_9NOCA|nr:hypothetical protein [Nocardia alba]TCJ93646.1 hypothetical protein DFR71_5496 [Nocardia alba]
MTALSTRHRVKAAALLGGAAVITATATGVASADPGERPDDGRATTIICTAPGGENLPELPPLPAVPGVRIERTAPGGQESGRIHIERAAPGNPAPPLDGPAQCQRIHSDGERTVVPAPGGFADVVPAPATGSADTQPAQPF